jgi:hypothetical protein
MHRIFVLVEDELPIINVCDRIIRNRYPLSRQNAFTLLAKTPEAAAALAEHAALANSRDIRLFATTFDAAIAFLEEFERQPHVETRIAIVSDETVQGSTTHANGLDFLIDMHRRFGDRLAVKTIFTSESDVVDQARRAGLTAVVKGRSVPATEVCMTAFRELRALH